MAGTQLAQGECSQLFLSCRHPIQPMAWMRPKVRTSSLVVHCLGHTLLGAVGQKKHGYCSVVKYWCPSAPFSALTNLWHDVWQPNQRRPFSKVEIWPLPPDPESLDRSASIWGSLYPRDYYEVSNAEILWCRWKPELYSEPIFQFLNEVDFVLPIKLFPLMKATSKQRPTQIRSTPDS